MAESGSGVKKFLLYGCGGCIGLVVLAALAIGAVVGVAAMRARTEQVEQRTLTREVAPPVADPPRTAAGRGASTPDAPRARRPAGRVLLDLHEAEFHIEPGNPGEPLRVEATYDERSYDLSESLTTDEGTGAWTYEVRFRRTASGLVTTLQQLMGGTPPNVRVYLPPDVPFGLELELGQGGARADLGGLWLTDADLRLEQCGVELDFHEPLREPLERLRIRAKMGGFEARGVGNASPRVLDVDFSMGGLDLDLEGEWLQDADVSIRSHMGGGVVRLPRDVVVRGLEGRGIAPPDRPEVGRPTLRFEVSASMGELQILD